MVFAFSHNDSKYALFNAAKAGLLVIRYGDILVRCRQPVSMQHALYQIESLCIQGDPQHVYIQSYYELTSVLN